MMDVTSTISIIIPVYNEAEGIGDFLREVNQRVSHQDASTWNAEWIIVDGGSQDNSIEEIEKTGFKAVVSPKKGRAAQMNYGASLAKGNILYFLHADTIPPFHFIPQILKAIRDGVGSGCFRLAFDEPHPIMNMYAWFTKFDVLPFRFGDQSLFVTKEVWEKTGIFKEDHVVMEDNEYIKRLRKRGDFRILNDQVVTSARKYRENGFIRLQFIFSMIYVMYYAGASQQTLVDFYKIMIKDNRL